jgi:hypothetical protein
MYGTSVRSLTLEEMQSPAEIQCHLEFDKAVTENLGAAMII